MEAGESDDTRDRHFGWVLGLAERAAPELARADGPAWLATLERDQHNLRGALEWAEVTRGHEVSLRLATALTLFWDLRGHLGDGGPWFARILAHDDGPSGIR